ncbi:LysM peptidoglycan-binding domain-containing protein [Undibacterium fentianense]|uniref:LysM peptidoglycan-binding domain-containing protein n=1 Tax=Undibacterium fentianense TaxID=2828728 RepID=A0A941E4A1_9BURK|nr:LysM peptidoglycan-binding domain-containing protein [Undibacterium fentianense]MBR7800324.1 LysM peptidoglycan-binding domain-containing protein [Undibacterium fentianense]
MKKFSTIVLAMAFPLAFSLPVYSQDSGKTPPSLSSKCNFLPDAPDKHVVVRGDTLWGISGRFLQNPWCWPEVWGMNREEIRNPHWIYPKQIVYFDRVNGRLRLANPIEEGPTGVTKLNPQTRSATYASGDAISAIPNNLIEPYLSQPLIIDKDEFANAPRIVAAPEGRVYMGKDDKIYVRGDLKNGTSFQVFRPGIALKDPDSKEVIGYEAVYIGAAKLERVAKTADGVDTFTIVTSKEEMGIGDRLVPIPPTPIINYVPHAPEQDVMARVVAVYGGVSFAGQNNIISINRGSSSGIDVGTVLELGRYGKIVPDRTNDKKPVRLPDEMYGQLFIFRVFKNISYGLVMQVTDVVSVGDIVRTPVR